MIHGETWRATLESTLFSAAVGQWAWLDDYRQWLWALGLLSVVTLIFSVVVLPIVMVRLPADYFVRRPVKDWPTRSPAAHITLVVLKNLLGVVFVLAGIAMLVLPGQGLLTIFIGILLLDFPGKRRVERWLIRLPRLLQTANWMRARYGQPPFEFELHEQA
ncbi:MAG: PGPGW domain-containing protein [Pirellulaceae bacterium]|nr:PGPGW domain-containing protein [Pirellulaceae bacterium]